MGRTFKGRNLGGQAMAAVMKTVEAVALPSVESVTNSVMQAISLEMKKQGLTAPTGKEHPRVRAFMREMVASNMADLLNAQVRGKLTEE